MRFKAKWDKTLKDYHNLILKTYCYNIIISSRTPWFEKKENGDLIYHTDAYVQPSDIAKGNIEVLIKLNNSKEIYKDKEVPVNWSEKEYAQSHFVSGHFIFSTSDFFKDIIPDPRILMFGEEHTFALRAWTNDYRIFTVKETVVFHLGKNSEYRQTLGVGDFANQYDKIDHSRSNEAQRNAF